MVGGKNANFNTMETTKHINLNYLNTIADGSNAFVKEMLLMLSSEMPSLLEEMQTTLQEKNWHRLNRIAHKLKPHFEMLGINSVYEDIRSIENFSLEQTNLEQIPDLVNKVIDTCQQALVELKSEYL